MRAYQARQLRRFRTTPVCAVALAAGVGAAVGAAPPAGGAATSNTRLVHYFDFAERDEGNLERVPKYWEPLRLPTFPRFAEGGFDHQVGHAAPPSFRLQSSGRNVAYEYRGPELPARPLGHYRVRAFVLPDRLEHARACVCAFFRDRHGNPLLDTLTRTAYLSSSDPAATQADRRWRRIELLLPEAPPPARTIGLAVWVLQGATWNASRPPLHEIEHVDVHGGVWVDDISVTTLPRILLETSAPGNVLTPADPAELVVRASDHDPILLQASLVIRSADGAVALTREFPITLDGTERVHRIPLDKLPVGWYRAALSVRTGGSEILTRHLALARAAGSLSTTPRGTTTFGVSLTPETRSDPLTELALLERQGTRSAKIPVWSSHHDPSTERAQARDHDTLVQELQRRGFALTAVLAEVPASLKGAGGAYARSVIELLGDAPQLWQGKLASLAAPYASTYRWWQIGPDNRNVEDLVEQFERGAKRVRATLRPFALMPRISAHVSHAVDPQAPALPVEQVTIGIDPSIPLERVGGALTEAHAKGYQQVSALVEWHDATRFDRLGRLANWAQRAIVARHRGAGVVYAPPTWHVRHTPFGAVTEPREEFLILRTLADVLGDAPPGPKVPLPDGIECYAFQLSADETVLALWDSTAGSAGREHEIQLGAATQVVDLWGRSAPLQRDRRGRHRIRLTHMPVLVPHVERWLVQFRSSLSIGPDRVAPGRELQQHRIEASYHGATPITGRGTLATPKGWRVSPRTFALNYSSGAADAIVQEIRYSRRKPEGVTELILRALLDNSDYFLEIPLWIEIGHDDLDVKGLAVVEGEVLVVEHWVRNRTDEPISLRGYIAVPGRMRQYRPLAAIPPGQTQRVEYRFEEASALTGRHILLSLREIRDNPRTHDLELIVP